MSTLRRPFLYLFIISMTVIPYYFQMFGIAINNVVSLVFLILYFFITKGKVRVVKIEPGLRIIFCLWGASRCVTYFYHAEFSRAFLFLVSFFGLCWIICDAVRTESDFKDILDLIINIAGIVCLFGIIESVTHFNIFSLFNNSGAVLNYNGARFGLVRIITFTGQTINYCLYCSIVACLTLYRLGTAVSKKRIFELRVIYALLCVNILLTLSRSIIICFIIIQILLFYRMGFITLVKKIVLIIALIFLISFAWSLVLDSENLIMQFVYMIGAVFDSSFASKLSSNWGSEDKAGIGNRIDLYYWVYASVKNNLLLGMGEKARFVYTYIRTDGIYTWMQAKESIEVNFLSLLYHYGIISAVLEAMVYVRIALSAFWKSRKFRFNWEGQINYSFLTFAILIMDLISWIMVNSEAELFTLYLVIFMFVAYSSIQNNRGEV